MLYHGPVDALLPFFSGLGFTCPPRKEVPAFLQDVTHAPGQRSVAQPALLAAGAGSGRSMLVPLEEIEQKFWGQDSGPGADMKGALATAMDKAAFADVPKARQPVLARGAWPASWGPAGHLQALFLSLGAFLAASPGPRPAVCRRWSRRATWRPGPPFICSARGASSSCWAATWSCCRGA